ncbi:MAG: hypothetical protein ACRDWX_01180 [Acidimicrobiia bacterium]
MFAEFLAERDRPTTKRSHTDRRSIVELLEHCIDGYAYESLSKDEKEFWEPRWEADETKNSYCRTFGPEKILEQVGHFLGWFIIRKVAAGPGIAKAAGPVVGELLEWCEQKGYLSGDELQEAKARAAEGGADLPRADKLADLLHDLTQKQVAGRVLEDRDLINEQMTISKVAPGKLWFSDWDGERSGRSSFRKPRAM